MNRIYIALLATIISFAACKTTVHIHFNKDNSGYVEMEYDMAEFIANSDDTTGTFIDSLMEGMSISTDTIPYVKKYKVTATQTGIKIRYEFADIEGLNKSLAFINRQSDTGVATEPPKFKAKRNKIIYTTPPNRQKKDENAEILGDFFTAVYKVSFERKIVKCNNKNYKWNKEENYIELSGGLNDYKLNKEANFTVKLK